MKKKIAILGGGIGAITAAFELTREPDWQDHYEVTVYQMGWRLGGKCASGRNALYGDRIEEHGLHIWLGFYHNSFRLIQDCYKELARPAGTPLATWEEAFKKHSLITLMEKQEDRWQPWVLNFPVNQEVPGEGGLLLKNPWDYVRMLLAWLVNWHDNSEASPRKVVPGWEPHKHLVANWMKVIGLEVLKGAQLFQETVVRIETLLVEPVAAGLAWWDTHLHHAHRVVHRHPEDPQDEGVYNYVRSLLEKFFHGYLGALEQEVDRHPGLRHAWILLRLGVAIIIGMLKDEVCRKGFDAIDQKDFTEWLRYHGATNPEVYWSAPVRGIYELVFGYEGGDTHRPNLAAGTALRGALRMFFTYKGAIFWKMQAGMADTIFTPFYQVLKQRGVRFEFFHRVTNLGVSADGQFIDTIAMGVQATVRPEVKEYQPLRPIKDLWCWPSAPDYNQLVEGPRLRAIDLESAWTSWKDVTTRQLQRGQDFDQVILGISIGAFPYICRELMAANSAWRAMVDHVKTTPTQAVQFWFTRDAEELGWHAPARALVSSYVEPLDTWADMSQLLTWECWPDCDQVKNIAYLCGPLAEVQPLPPFTELDFPKEQEAAVKQEALRFLQTCIGPLWPNAAADPQNPIALDWQWLAAGSGAAGVARLEVQYFRANIEPSERYVLSVKGSTPYRLKPDASGFANLFLAGDWTYNGINAGCVEAATISGLQAAQAVTGQKTLIVGATDFEQEPEA
jgi:uncharacterized protein with NAD-binding domain and iron-sulfur cluster